MALLKFSFSSFASQLLLHVLRRWFWRNSYLMFFGVGVPYRILCSFVGYSHVHVNGSGSITSVGEERANLSAIVYL